MTKREVVLIGGGGHCKSVIDVIEVENKFKIIGILDFNEYLGQKLFDYNYIGTDADYEFYIKKKILFLITIGHISNKNKRVSIFNSIKKNGGHFATIISPVSYVSKRSEIGEGSVIMHKSLINTGAKIGSNSIINTGAIVEHDAFIGNHSHISTNSTINGDCFVGEECFIGSGSVVKQSTKICNKVFIGAGTLVTKDIIDPGLYYGIPAKKK
jgi:sugar O-acyltransferase (sialic acid O-acetyltransferase NeuD family)